MEIGIIMRIKKYWKGCLAIATMAALALSCNGNAQKKGFTRQYSSDSTFSIEVPNICEFINAGDGFIAYGNDEKMTFVSVTKMPEFDFKQFDAMTTAEANKSAENLSVTTVERTDSVIKLRMQDGSYATDKYYFHKKGMADDFLVVVESYNNTLSEKDVRYVIQSLHEEKAVVPMKTLAGDKVQYANEGFALDKSYKLSLDKTYMAMNAKRKLSPSSPKLVSSYSCIQDTLDAKNATYVTISVYDIKDATKFAEENGGIGAKSDSAKGSLMPLDMYIRSLQDRGVPSKKTEFKSYPAAIYSYDRKTADGHVIPTKAAFVVRGGYSYTLEISSKTDVAPKFDAFVSAFEFI
jgi:hypothetical protein